MIDPYNLNFYRIHGLRNKELIHSRFIAFLLNPKESHGYNRDFLEEFIEIINQKSNDKIGKIPKDLQCESVERERGCKINRKEKKGGRVDIIIINNKDRHIIIENKIYARDQEGQLINYHNEYEEAFLVYITLNGKKASSYSLVNPLKKDDYMTEDDYIKLSYKDDITAWIKNCISLTNNDSKISFLLKEYQVMLERLTKNLVINEEILKILTRDQETFEYDKILPILGKNKETLKYVFKIYDEVKKKGTGINDYDKKREILQFINPLKEYIIKTKFYNKPGIKDTFLLKLCDKIGGGLEYAVNENKNILEKDWGFQFYKKEWENLNIKIGFEFNNKGLRDCFFGLCKYNSSNSYVPEFEERKINGNWLYTEPLRDEYRNWFREVFIDDLVEVETERENGLFLELEKQIRIMIEKIKICDEKRRK